MPSACVVATPPDDLFAPARPDPTPTNRRETRRDLPRHDPDPLSRRCFPARSASRSPATRWRARSGRSRPATSAITASVATATWTIRRRAAVPAWCCAAMCWRRRIDAASPADDPRPRLLMTPRGKPLTQGRVRDLAAGPGAVIVCGRFEGVDERVIEGRGLEEISIGDYVLSGGEMAAMVLLDACVRLLPGVMGKEASGADESFESEPPRISALHAAARMGGQGDPRGPAQRQPRRHRTLAARGGGADHARAAAGSAEESRANGEWRMAKVLRLLATRPLATRPSPFPFPFPPKPCIAAHNSQQDAEILRGTGISREACATAGV